MKIELKIEQVPLDCSWGQDVLGKWFASRDSGQTEKTTIDIPVRFLPNEEEEEYETIWVDNPIYEYLHPDGTWKYCCYYFNTKEEIEAIL